MNERIQFKNLLEKSKNKYKEFEDYDYKYLVFSDFLDDTIIMVAEFNADDLIKGFYVADGICCIDDFEYN